MATTRLLIEYDGTRFAGWAKQPGLRTVQGEIERVLAIVGRGTPVLTCGGRTDSGVHAIGQVASYAGAPVLVRSLNALLPSDVAVVACEDAPDGFDARRDAVARSYRYRIDTRRQRSPFTARTALHLYAHLDRDLLHRCAAALPGVHDFTAFTPTETEHVHFRRRVLAAAWEDHGRHLEFTITAEAFMRNMNRVLVGTMLEVARGRRELDDFAGLLDGAPRERAGVTAPPHGLTLEHIEYPPGLG